MGAAQPLDNEITHYLGHLSTEQKEVVDEMDRRFKDLETGKVKGLKPEDLATRARQAYKIKKRKKS